MAGASGDADLQAQALAWLDQIANPRVHGTTREVPRERFERDERGVLGPLAERPYRSLVLLPDPAPLLPPGPGLPRIQVERRPSRPTPRSLERADEGDRLPPRPGELRSKAFRHTYCAARLQTLDRGAPVSIYTVARERGHGSDEMVKRIYAHLGDVPHRSEVVEYRVEQHVARLGDRLERLGLAGPSVTGNVTGSAGAEGTREPSATEVMPGEEFPESGRPDSNRRRPAWEASDPSEDERPPA